MCQVEGAVAAFRHPSPIRRDWSAYTAAAFAPAPARFRFPSAPAWCRPIVKVPHASSVRLASGMSGDQVVAILLGGRERACRETGEGAELIQGQVHRRGAELQMGTPVRTDRHTEGPSRVGHLSGFSSTRSRYRRVRGSYLF